MAVPSAGLIMSVRVIDTFSVIIGKLVAWHNVPLVLSVSYDVFAR